MHMGMACCIDHFTLEKAIPALATFSNVSHKLQYPRCVYNMKIDGRLSSMHSYPTPGSLTCTTVHFALYTLVWFYKGMTRMMK